MGCSPRRSPQREAESTSEDVGRTPGCQLSTTSTPVQMGAVGLTQETPMTVIVRILDANVPSLEPQVRTFGRGCSDSYWYLPCLDQVPWATVLPTPCPAACPGNVPLWPAPVRGTWEWAQKQRSQSSPLPLTGFHPDIQGLVTPQHSLQWAQFPGVHWWPCPLTVLEKVPVSSQRRCSHTKKRFCGISSPLSLHLAQDCPFLSQLGLCPASFGNIHTCAETINKSKWRTNRQIKRLLPSGGGGNKQARGYGWGRGFCDSGPVLSYFSPYVVDTWVFILFYFLKEYIYSFALAG